MSVTVMASPVRVPDVDAPRPVVGAGFWGCPVVAGGAFAGWFFGGVAGGGAPCAGAVGAGAVCAGAGAVCAGGVFVAEFCAGELLAAGVCATTLTANVVRKLSSRTVRMNELQRRSCGFTSMSGPYPAERGGARSAVYSRLLRQPPGVSVAPVGRAPSARLRGASVHSTPNRTQG